MSSNSSIQSNQLAVISSFKQMEKSKQNFNQQNNISEFQTQTKNNLDSRNENFNNKEQQEINLEEQQQKKRLQSLSKLLAMLQKQGQQKVSEPQNPIQQAQPQQQQQQNNNSKKSITSNSDSKASSVISSQNDLYKKKNSQNQSYNSQYNNGSSARKPKSKFAKQHTRFQNQQPIIITSSHKSFFTSSKNNINVNVNSPSSKFLTPNNNSSLAKKGSKRQLTSAGNLINQQQGQSQNLNSSNNLTNKSGSNIKSSTHNKSSSQIGGKTATFADLPARNQQISGGVSLYEQVLAKNFEVIDNLLRKLNQIYSHQEEYQSTITEISQKLHKLQVDNQNIHHQFRTSHFMIDKKLNSISNQYSNIVQDMNLMKKILSQSHGGAAMNSYFVNSIMNGDDQVQQSSRRKRKSGSKKIGPRKSSRFRRDSIHRTSINNGSPANNDPNLGQSRSSQRRLSKQRVSAKKSMMMERKNSNWKNLKGLDEQNFGKILLQQINESSSQISSSEQSNEFDSNVLSSSTSNKFDRIEGSQQFSESLIQYKNQKKQRKYSKYGQVIKKSSLSKQASSRKRNNKPKISIDSLDLQQMSQIKNVISHQFLKMSQNSQEMKKFAHMGIETMIIRKLNSFQQKIQDQLLSLKKQILEEKIEKQFKQKIMQQVQQKIKLIMSSDIQNFKIQTKHKVDILQNKVKKQVQKKVDKEQMRQDLRQILDSMNRRVNNLMDQCYNKFAERQQSKRAILFLQKKINKIIETQKRFNLQASMQTDQNVKCLSCDKNIVFNNTLPSQSYKMPSQQPMFTQVHFVHNSQNLESQVFNKDQNSMQTARKNISQRNKQNSYSLNVSPNKPSVRFADTTNNCSKNQHNNQNNQNSNGFDSNTVKPNNQNSKSSKQLFLNKIKNISSSDNNHLATSNGRFSSTNHQNRPTTSNFSINQVSQKNWKQKASTMLKKQAMNSTTNSTLWRSKSTHKKA